MCKKTDCVTSSCGCCNYCKCNLKCHECKIANSFNPPGCVENELRISDVRNKYVCFNCEHIWKSTVSKYMRYGELDRTQIQNYYNVTRDEQIDLIYSYCDVYTHKTSKCAKCGEAGLLVGRNFRHCRNKKEWNILKQKVNDGKIDLYKDFYDYPKIKNK